MSYGTNLSNKIENVNSKPALKFGKLASSQHQQTIAEQQPIQTLPEPTQEAHKAAAKEVKQFISLPLTAPDLRRSHPKLFDLLLCLILNHQTYKYGMVGAHEKLTMKKLALALGAGNNIDRDLKKLEKLGYIKIFNTAPVLLQILDLPTTPPLKGIYETLELVRANRRDFNMSLRWEREFFTIYAKHYDDIENGVADIDPFGFAPTNSQ